MDAKATIELHTVQIGDNTALIINLLRVDAERQIAEFEAALQIEIDVRINQVKLTWEKDFETRRVQIELHFAALIADLNNNGEAEVDRERAIITLWIQEQITKIRGAAQV